MTTIDEIYGYAGKILRIDLTTGSHYIEPTIKYAGEWLGARGIGQKILFDELRSWMMPYDPANRLVIGAGPLVGTLVPAATRCSVASKSTFSFGVGTANIGGFFGPELKFAGYDNIVITGKAVKPVYLWIDDERVELKDARGIWGKTTWEAHDLIEQEVGDNDVQILCIGPAGENLVRGACIIGNRNRAAGKCGLGAVMGSKNLKAIAVRGTGAVKVAQPERFMEAVDKARSKIESSEMLKGLTKYGTQGIFPVKNRSCSIPYKNFRETHVPEEAARKLAPDVFDTGYKVRNIGYMGCPISCSNYYRIDEGPYAGTATEGFQLQTLNSMGGKLAIDYPPAIIKAFTVVNQLGIDVDSATTTIAWAFECFEKGILTEEDTDGMKLVWGDHAAVFELMRKQAYREGFGNLLAEGCKFAADIIGKGSDYYAITAKGQDLYEEGRSIIGWGLGAWVATRGGGHTTGGPSCEIFTSIDPQLEAIAKERFGVTTLDPMSYDQKENLVFYFERLQELTNSMGICMSASAWQDPEQISYAEIAELYSAATGWETSQHELIRIADRIFNLEKAFNVLHGNLGRKDDYPPERCLKEPVTGPLGGFRLSLEEYDKLIDRYYALHGWDTVTGLQTRETLEALDLADVADRLERANKLIVQP